MRQLVRAGRLLRFNVEGNHHAIAVEYPLARQIRGEAGPELVMLGQPSRVEPKPPLRATFCFRCWVPVPLDRWLGHQGQHDQAGAS